MDDGLGPENILQPPIVSKILVGHHYLGTVIERFRLLMEPPVWLEPNENIPIPHSRDYQAAFHIVKFARRVSPIPANGLLRGLGDGVEPSLILAALDESSSPFLHILGR
ncbi:MAG: hypothetical protein A4E31_00074 [Methanomassiliicoccales archaeon PtaU1.Bin030]|nr:MAG: hypothetical protein A4E31_00074 [Methanomassiliicoccales archaeon PtaU1.Bin030]